MPAWATFAGLTAVLVALLLVLSRSSQRVLEEAVVVDADGRPATDSEPDADDASEGPGDDADGSDDPGIADDPPGDRVGSGDARADPFADPAPPSESGASTSRTVEPDTGAGPETDPARDTGSGLDPATDRRERTADGPPADRRERTAGGPPADRLESTADGPPAPGAGSRPRVTTRALLANVVVSQGLFLGLLVVAAWWTDVPAAAFGLAATDLTATHALLGAGLGVAVYLGNEVGAALGDRFGFSAPERLRRAMAPSTGAEWAFLLGVALPVIAVFEELLFRGALIGVLAAGFGLDPWLLAVVSSAVFGLGHGAQGRVGIAVTGLLGLVLAAAFVRTGSLLLVVVAHYVVNALEFLVREAVGWEPLADRLSGA